MGTPNRMRGWVLVAERHCAKSQQKASFGKRIDQNHQIVRANFFMCTGGTLIQVAEKNDVAYHVKSYHSIYITLFLVRIFRISVDFRFHFNFRKSYFAQSHHKNSKIFISFFIFSKIFRHYFVSFSNK